MSHRDESTNAAAPRRVAGVLVLLLAGIAAAPARANGPNLLSNPAFDADLSGWNNLTGVDLRWKPTDADGAVTSGSLLVTNDQPFAFIGSGASQCLSVVPGTTYTFGASAWIPAGQPTDISAGISAFFYGSPNCDGVYLGFQGWPYTYVQGRWVSLAATSTAPTGAVSVYFLLASGKGADSLFDAGVYFDAPYFAVGECAPGPTRLCLGNGRFLVETRWTRPDHSSGPGMAVPSSGDSGRFWFFDSGNIEMDVKVLDACVPALGNRFWVFAAGLTNVEVIMTVTDTETGAVKTYTNPANTVFKTITDVNAFATCP